MLLNSPLLIQAEYRQKTRISEAELDESRESDTCLDAPLIWTSMVNVVDNLAHKWHILNTRAATSAVTMAKSFKKIIIRHILPRIYK